MAKLDGKIVPAIMVAVLIAGLLVATMFTAPEKTAAEEAGIEGTAPQTTGVLKRRDTVRFRTVTSANTGTTRGFKQAPTGQ